MVLRYGLSGCGTSECIRNGNDKFRAHDVLWADLYVPFLRMFALSKDCRK